MGAVVKNYNKVAFEKCIFKNNIAKIGNGREYCGGVLSAESNSHSVFVDCKFSSNTDNFFADDFSSIVIYSNTYPVTTQLLDKPYFSKKATFSVVKSSVLNNTGIVNYECNDTTDFELLIRLINTMPKASGIVINLKIFYDRTVSGGKGLAKLNINLEQGKYIITAINLVTGESRANNITIIPRIIENNDLTKYYRNASQYSVKLLGDDGKAVGACEEVIFNINGVFYTRTTNAS